MQHQRFGPTPRQVAIIGQGTWNIERSRRDEAIQAIRRGVDLGASHIDTAEFYGNGAAECLVGSALRGLRPKAFLTSKIVPERATRLEAIRACEASLRRLQTDYLDCYLLHWYGPHPLEDTVAAFESLVEQGKILSWGVSNFDEVKLAEVLRWAGPERIACNQVLYHLGERSVEHAVLPYCRQHRIAVVAYSPFGTERLLHEARWKALDALAQRWSMTTRQLALAFLSRQAQVFTIPKSSCISHVEENARAGDLRLDARLLHAVDALFPLGPRRIGVPLPVEEVL